MNIFLLADAKLPDTVQFLTNLGIGLLLGCIGQIARTAVGMKKEHDAANGKPVPFDGKQLGLSLLYGAAAGGIAAILMDNNKLQEILSNHSVALGLIGAGYSGSDFLEGLLTKAKGESDKLLNGLSANADKVTKL